MSGKQAILIIIGLNIFIYIIGVLVTLDVLWVDYYFTTSDFGRALSLLVLFTGYSMIIASISDISID